MKTIHKYPLSLTGSQVVRLPKSHKILDIQMQHESIVMWAEIDTAIENVSITIRIFGTGNKLEMFHCDRIYIKTLQIEEFVWHFYYEP